MRNSWPEEVIKLPDGAWRYDPFTGIRRYVTVPPIDRQDEGDFKPQPCGTTGAYARHRQNGEKPCDECREANRQYQRDRRRALAHRTAA